MNEEPRSASSVHAVAHTGCVAAPRIVAPNGLFRDIAGKILQSDANHSTLLANLQLVVWQQSPILDDPVPQADNQEYVCHDTPRSSRRQMPSS